MIKSMTGYGGAAGEACGMRVKATAVAVLK